MSNPNDLNTEQLFLNLSFTGNKEMFYWLFGNFFTLSFCIFCNLDPHPEGKIMRIQMLQLKQIRIREAKLTRDRIRNTGVSVGPLYNVRRTCIVYQYGTVYNVYRYLCGCINPLFLPDGEVGGGVGG